MSEKQNRRWTVPAAAAACVLGIAGIGALAASGGDGAPTHDGERDGAARLSGAETDDRCEAVPTAPGLAGMERAAEVHHVAGATSFWSDGSRWVVCNDPAELPTAPPVDVWAPPQRLGPDGLTERDLAFRALEVTGADGRREAVHFVAGGKLLTEVQEITYTFPDGHRETARIVDSADGSDDRWWLVTYTATGGPLLDGGRDGLGRTSAGFVTPASDAGGDVEIGGAAQAFVVDQDTSASLLRPTGR